MGQFSRFSPEKSPIPSASTHSRHDFGWPASTDARIPHNPKFYNTTYGGHPHTTFFTVRSIATPIHVRPTITSA